MRVFELYFNPKNKNKIAESFHHKPKDVYERKIGQLYMVGEIPEPNSNNISFLQNIFCAAKEFYYENTSLSPEKTFKETLKKINIFIKEKEYNERPNVAFLSSKNFALYLGKIGEIKVFLSNKEEIKDIGKDLDGVSNGLFQNMVSGKMKKDDKLIVLTSEIYNFFIKEKILEEIAKESLNKKLLEKISGLQKEKYPHISGVALIMDNVATLKEKETKIFSTKRTEIFSFKKFFTHYISSFKKIGSKKILIQKPKIEIKLKPPKNIKRNPFVLISLLFIVVLLGSAVMGIQNKIKSNKERKEIILIEEKITKGKTENDFSLLEEALFDLEKIKNNSPSINKEASSVYSSLEEYLFWAFNGEKVDGLNLLGEIKEASSEKIVYMGDKIYLFSSQSPTFIVYNIADKKEEKFSLPLDNGISLVETYNNKLVLFSAPDMIVVMDNGKFFSQKIKLPVDHENFIALSFFLEKPYLLNDKGVIYHYIDGNFFSWFRSKEEKVENAISIAIDGSIYILTSEGKIHRYHKGEKKEVITPLLYPSLATTKNIYTTPEENIFLTDPLNKRIVILDKKGGVVKQMFNEDFENIKDISISYKEKKIYLLISEKVYSLDF
jgi:hypothetical protein